MLKKLTLAGFLVVCCCCLVSSAMAQGHDVTDPACRAFQLEVQAAVGDEADYRNHGAYLSAVSDMVKPRVAAGDIDEECASCIVSQFARRIAIADQEPCGPDGVVKNLLGPEVTQCDGSLVGTVTFTPGAGLDVTVHFSNGPPNATLEVYWVCTLVPNGCHGDACNFISLGQVVTDGSGVGTLQTNLAGGNPYPGMYVHIDIQDLGSGSWYTHLGGDEIFPSTLTSSRVAPTTFGDPTRQ